jgi:ribose transport system substrate-binding protein
MELVRTKFGMIAVGIIAGGIALSGCSSSDSSSGAASAAPAATAAASAGASAAAEPTADIAGAEAALAEYSGPATWKEPGPAFDISGAKGKSVVYIPLDNSIPIFTVIYGEMEKALKEAGAVPSLCDGKGNPTQWAACISDAAGRGASVIILDSIPVASVAEAAKAAQEAGVKIIDGNNGDPEIVPEGTDARVSFQYSLSGRLVSDWIIADSAGDANVLIIQSPESGNVPDLVGKGYAGELTAKCPSCKVQIADVAIADWATKLQPTVQAALAADPSINYIIPIYDGMSTYVVPAIAAAGASDRVKVATFNANLDPMKKMAAGDSIFVDVGSHNAYEGWAYADQSLRLITGNAPSVNENVPARVFTRDNVGDLQLTPEAERSGEWYGDNTYQQKYKELWGLK